MSLRRQPQQQRSKQRLNRILEAAAEVFWDVGYEAATTHAIAARADTAVGTIYRFFPDKLAIFRSLEKQHYDSLTVIQSKLLTPQFIEMPLRTIVRDLVEVFANYFQATAPRVVYLQYFINPDMFVYFDAEYNAYLNRQFGKVLRHRNPSLEVDKSELIAQVFNQSYRALLLDAIRNYSSQFELLHVEMQVLLFQYLDRYVGDDICFNVDIPSFGLGEFEKLTYSYKLSPRQQAALAYIWQNKMLTIQDFEKLCPQISRRSLQRDLKLLVEKRLLVVEGMTNQLVYRLNKLATSSDIAKSEI